MVSRKNMSRKNRKNMSRKNRNSRKNMSRKNRSSRKNRCWSGGMAPVNDTSMASGQRDSLAQGNQYLNMHKGQYGGSAPYPTAVTGSVLTGPMIAAARTGPLDTAMAQIQGMQDGGRRRKGRKGRKGSKKMTKKMRKMRGGELSGSALSQDSMLLPAGMDKQAALNYEWSLAKNPNAFAPRA
jgi:hypothetical protein